MKFTAQVFVSMLCLHASQAFVHMAHFGTPRTRMTLGATPTEEAINYAMEMSKQHGVASKQAVLAWETVEEMSSSDNSAAFKGGVSDEECDIVNEAESDACREYGEKMDALQSLLKAQIQPIKDLESLVGEIKAIKMKDPTVAKAPQLAKISERVPAAIAAAKKASEEFGPTSSQAQLAWETVEELASADNSQAYASPLDTEECLTDLSEACEALSEIQKMLETAEAK